MAKKIVTDKTALKFSHVLLAVTILICVATLVFFIIACTLSTNISNMRYDYEAQRIDPETFNNFFKQNQPLNSIFTALSLGGILLSIVFILLTIYSYSLCTKPAPKTNFSDEFDKYKSLK